MLRSNKNHGQLSGWIVMFVLLSVSGQPMGSYYPGNYKYHVFTRNGQSVIYIHGTPGTPILQLNCEADLVSFDPSPSGRLLYIERTPGWNQNFRLFRNYSGWSSRPPQ